MSSTESIDTVVIGGGQAGLCVGYHLAQTSRPFVILDANAGTGDSWRNRWDSLLLFTPARFDGLPGMAFPASGGSFITKDQMADFVENYAAHFQLPVCRGLRVERLSRHGDHFVVDAGERRFEAENVVVAMSNCQRPWVPPFAMDLDPAITQLHSKDYRNPAQLRPGRVLVVGAGNSGADIGLELSRTHRTLLAGKESGHVPFRIEPFIARNGLIRIVRFVGHHVLSVGTPIGRRVRPTMLTQAAPLVRVKPTDLVKAGVERVDRVVGVSAGLPVLSDGTAIEVENVIWCTGFRPGFEWIDLPILGDRQEPSHERGIVASVPGLYFVGLHFLYSATSETITGVDRDAKRIVKHLTSRQRARPAAVGAASR
ncbi:MAG: NAD(P)-binding domain-containing protein [Mycobacteriales bacterium]